VSEYLAEGRPSALGAVIPLEGNPATQHVLETKVPLAVEEAQTDPRMAPIHRLMQDRGTVSLLILPLVVRKEVIGTIGLDAIEARCFSEAEIELAAAVASTAAQAIDTARLFAETRRRAGELEAVAEVSSAMRTAATRAEMYPIILNQLLFLLQADGAKLALRDPGTGEIVTQLARGAWASRTGERQPRGEGLIGRVIDSGRPYLNNSSLQSLPDGEIDRMADLHALACVPLIASEQAIGAICVGRQDPFNEEDLNLLNAICDMTANAIHRASLYEQTERRLQRLGALRMIDEAITASVDLRLTLNILLEQVANQLNIDAAAVLLLSPHTKVLEVAARRGFHTGALRNTRLRLGESDAGRAALMRQIVHVPDLSAKATDIGRAAVLAREGFMDYYAVPLIAKGQVKGVLEIFNRQPIASEPEWLDFLETLAGRAAIAIDNISLFDSLQRSNVELMLAYDATIEGWARALELRDRETKGHSQRVTEMTLQLASVLGLTEVELEHTRRGTLLHDIGKMGIPDQILNKPGPLTDQEWEIMRQHPVYAYNMLTPIAFLRPALDIPYCHHEKWDGSGYPRGLSGEQIPLTARIFAVVDVWDALRSDRPYRSAWPEQKALDYIKGEAGKHFDPQVVKEFLKLVNHQ
jgi:putative nucleotidyltransferase with HDIG domain